MKRVVLLVALAMVLIATCAWLVRQRSEYPEAVMADGTRIQFVGYTYRERHTNYVGSALRERIRAKLPASMKPMLGRGLIRASSSAPHEYLVAWLLITRPPGAPAALGNPFVGRGARLDVTDSHGCVFAGKEWSYSGAASDGKRDLMFKPMPVFPRREPKITLRFMTRNGDVSELRIPNPEFRSYAEWRPERMRQSTGQFTLEFHGWRKPDAPDIAYRTAGGPPVPVAPRKLTLADATGNSNAVSLCVMETAFRVQDDLIVRPLAPKDMLELRSLRIPAANEVEVKQQRLLAGTNEIVFLALTGKGQYSVAWDGYTDSGTSPYPLVFLVFPTGTSPTDFAVWINNRRAPVSRAGTAAGQRPVFGYFVDVPTPMANVEVGLEPCVTIDLLVPPPRAGVRL